MSYDEYLLKRTDESTFIDGSVMYEMSDADYRDYVRNCLFFVDHHGALRLDSNGGQIIAANEEQFDILTDCVFRSKPITRSARSRSGIPLEADH